MQKKYDLKEGRYFRLYTRLKLNFLSITLQLGYVSMIYKQSVKLELSSELFYIYYQVYCSLETELVLTR